MNLTTLHFADDSQAIDINMDRIETVFASPDVHERGTHISLSSGLRFRVKETPAEMRALLNPMRAFAGKRDVDTAAEQDTRTKLLIEAAGALVLEEAAPDLCERIRKEVGEAAIEQYVKGIA